MINVYTWQQSVDEKRVCFYLTVDKKLMLLLDSNQLIKKSIKRILTQKVNNNCVSSSNQLIKMILTQKVNNNCVSSERVHSSFLKAQFYYIQGCSMPYSSNGPTALHVFKLITYKKKNWRKLCKFNVRKNGSMLAILLSQFIIGVSSSKADLGLLQHPWWSALRL